MSRAGAVPQTVPARIPIYGPACCRPYSCPGYLSQIAHRVPARPVVPMPGHWHGAFVPVGPTSGSRHWAPHLAAGRGGPFRSRRGARPVDRGSNRLGAGRARRRCTSSAAGSSGASSSAARPGTFPSTHRAVCCGRRSGGKPTGSRSWTSGIRSSRVYSGASVPRSSPTTSASRPAATACG